jgi:hypothetical protein
LKQLSKHLTFANAISCIALFVALSGAAYAATTTLGKKSVKTQNLANGSVTTLKLRGGSVTNLKLRNGAVTGNKIAPGTIGSSLLANGSIRSEQLGGGVVTSGKLKNGAVNGEKLAGGSVTTEKIANGAVTNPKLGADSVTAGKIQNGAVGSASLAPSFLAQLVRNVSYASKTSLSNTTEKSKSVTAECSAGKQVVGGGARIVGATTKVSITESAAAVSAEKRTGWSVAARDIPETEGTNWAVEAVAICAEF